MMFFKYISSWREGNVFCTTETVRRLCSSSEKVEAICISPQSQTLTPVELESLRKEMRLAGAWMQSVLRLGSRSKYK